MAYTKQHVWANLDDDLLNKIFEATLASTDTHASYLCNLRLVSRVYYI